MTFGLNLSVERAAAMMAFVNILLGLITRQAVVATAALNIQK